MRKIKEKIYFFGEETRDIIIERRDGMKAETGNFYMKIKGKWVKMFTPKGITEIERNGNTINSYIREKKDKGENNMEDNKKPTEQRNLKKSDLKNGDIVELRSGEKYVYIEQYINWYIYNTEPIKKIVGLKDGYSMKLSNYDNNLFFENRDDCKFDIMKILDMSEFYNNPKWTLERKQEEMTLEEICQELGRDIKIVKEKSND